MGACHCCQTFWDPQCQRACGSERSSLETPHRSTATTLRFAKWHRTWWYSQVVRKQRREPLRFRAAPERHFDSNHRATADVTKRYPGICTEPSSAIKMAEKTSKTFLLFNLRFFYLTGEVLRVVFSRIFLGANLPWSPRRWLLHCFFRQMIYSTQRVDLFCALCTSWSVAKYCHLCW